MVLNSYKFLQIPTVTSNFPTSVKTWLPRQLSTLLTMAESEESVPSVSAASSSSFLAVSTPLESVATTSNASVVSHLSGILFTLCFTELLPSFTITQWLRITHLDLTLISVVKHIPWNVFEAKEYFIVEMVSHDM